MRIETARAIAAAADEIGIEIETRTDYSVRGMFGRTTAALVLDNPADLSRAIAIASVRVRDADQFGKTKPDINWDDFVADLNYRTDNMGRGWVIY